MNQVNTRFKLVFFTAVFLTLLSGGASLKLASQSHLSSHQDRIFEHVTSNWQMGVGAIFGLMGGKATDSFQTKEEE